jgi:hypothetical protein
MGLISGGTYFLCDVCTNDGNTYSGVTVTNTPHPTYTNNLTGNNAVQLNAVTVGGFNGLNNSPLYENY